ncbi:MAG: hypothetical protein FH749_13760 [Firmicutes bacterium]|nr:hypothetical protein [Bacillota bacterium]
MQKVALATVVHALAAIAPSGSDCSKLYLADGRILPDPRQVRSLVIALARHFAVDIAALRQRCRSILYCRNYTPLPLAPDLVLVPLALAPAVPRLGYVNFAQVVGILPADDGCIIQLQAGQLPCYQGLVSVRARMQQAELVLTKLGYTDRDRELKHKLELLRALLEQF